MLTLDMNAFARFKVCESNIEMQFRGNRRKDNE